MAGLNGKRQNDLRRLLAAVLLSLAVHVVLVSLPAGSRLPVQHERYFIEIGLVEATEFSPDRIPVRNLAQPTSAKAQRLETESEPQPPVRKTVPIPSAESPEGLGPQEISLDKAAPAGRPAEREEPVVAEKSTVPEQEAPGDPANAEEPFPDLTSQRSVAEMSPTRNRTQPRPLSTGNPSPNYPRLALRRGWEGEVVLRVRVSSSGRVERVRVHTSSGHALLDDSAVEAVQGWRFRPARQGEQPVAAVVRVPVRFRLQKG